MSIQMQTTQQNYVPLDLFGGMIMMGMCNGRVVNGIFDYTGKPIQLETHISSLNQEQMNFMKQARIRCAGSQIADGSMLCYACTLFWGTILIIPMFFMCCGWWKKITQPAFQIPESTYISFDSLIKNPNLQNLTLQLVDNKLNAKKANILFDMLRKSKLKGFTLINGAGEFNFQENEYSNFIKNFKPIKKLPFHSEIVWRTNIVTS